jgi:hypothetical protein
MKKIFCVLVLVITFFVFGCSDPINQKIEITGIIRLVGAEPFTEYVISNEYETYFLEGDWFEYLNEQITIKGYVRTEEYTTLQGDTIIKKIIYNSIIFF